MSFLTQIWLVSLKTQSNIVFLNCIYKPFDIDFISPTENYHHIKKSSYYGMQEKKMNYKYLIK